MDMKVAFRVAVIVAVVVLVIVLILQITMDLIVPLIEGEIGYFNLLIDILVGIFTVWGLYWAASELALKPELRLFTETTWSGVKLRRNVLIGSKKDGLLECNLFVMNTRPKAARHIQVVLDLAVAPPPSVFAADPVPGAFTDWVRFFEAPLSFSLRAQFGGDLVIYKGKPIHVGILKVGWPHLSDYRPGEVKLEASLYSLEGEPKKEVISLPVTWVGL